MNSELFTVYRCEVELTEPMLGTVPANKQVYTDYIRDKEAEKRVPVPEADAEAVTQADEEVLDLGAKGYTSFYQDKEGHPILMDYQIKGFLKEAGNIMKDVIEGSDAKGKVVEGFKALRSHIDNELFVFPRRIKIADKVDPEPLERPLRAMTQQGPRVALVKSDTVPEGTTFEFEIRVLKHSKINEGAIRLVLDYGAVKGFGQWRNGGYGRFEYRLTAMA